MAFFGAALYESIYIFALNSHNLVHIYYPVSAFFLLIMIYALQMCVWKIIMDVLGITIKISGILNGYWLSFLPRYLPGSIWGYFSRNEWLKRDYEVPYWLGTTSSVIEIGFVVFSASFFLLNFYIGNIIIVLLSFLVVLWLVPYIGRYSIDNNRIKQILKDAKLKILQGVLERLTFSKLLICFILAVLIWLLFGLTMEIILTWVVGFGDFSLVSILRSSSIFSKAWLVGFFAVIFPGGIGIREIVLVNDILQNVAITSESASFIAITLRLLSLLTEFTWIGCGYITRLAKNKNNP